MTTVEGSIYPDSLEAEQAVIGSLLIDPDAIQKISDILRVEDFYRERHGWIYQAILDLTGRGSAVDFITVSDYLTSKGVLQEVGGASYLTECVGGVPSAVYVEHYARILVETATKRALINAASAIAAKAQGDGDIDEIRAGALALIGEAAARGVASKGLQPASVAVANVLDEIEHPENRRIIPTGYTDLDRLLVGGFRPGNLITLAARPRVGKSALALCSALRIASSGKRVAYFSMEMSSEQLAYRALTLYSGIPHSRLIGTENLDADDWLKLVEAASAISELSLFFEDRGGLSVDNLRMTCKRFGAVDFLVVDYLGLMAAPEQYRGNRVAEVGSLSRGMKGLARELDIPIFLLAQMSRSIEHRDSKIPTLADLRDSGEIEQDSDCVIFISRDELNNPMSTRKGVADLYVAKHRHGPEGIVQLAFQGERMAFLDAEIIKMPLVAAVTTEEKVQPGTGQASSTSKTSLETSKDATKWTLLLDPEADDTDS